MPSKSNLKIIAIKPLANCDRKYTKAIIPGMFYPLLQNYEYKKNSKGDVISVIANSSADQLYNQQEEESEHVEGNKFLQLNISAIVGKNGSGKSALMELFYLAIYIASVEQGVLEMKKVRGSKSHEEKEYEKICATFKLEVYFEIDNYFHCLVIDNNPDYIEERTSGNIKFYHVLQRDMIANPDFFYSIIVNYSIYGLNEVSLGPWLRRLFHKNDGYKTPLVINPLRDHGNIDILSEIHLAQSRLLSNLRRNKGENDFQVISNKHIKEIRFLISSNKSPNVGDYKVDKIVENIKVSTGLEKDGIFKSIFYAILGEDAKLPDFAFVDFANHIIKYVIRKVIKICITYDEYKKKYLTSEKNNMAPSIENFFDYLKNLATDPTHITLKLRQALNALRYNMFRLDKIEGVDRKGQYIIFKTKAFAGRISLAASEHVDREPVEFVPAGIFHPQIIMDDGSDFFSLSSGEQQFIHSMQSVIYHVANINSISKANDDKRLNFTRINVILDEIELYFHPEFQRRYIFELMVALRRLHITEIRAINIIFLTHSPFILSDIPKDNLLKLNDGIPCLQLQNTFAGNIHSMLSESFFMSSTMGEFAKQQYEHIIDFHTQVRNADKDNLKVLKKKYAKKRKLFIFIVSNIGEEILQGILQNHIDFLDNILSDRSQADQELIASMLERRRKIDRDLKNMGYAKD